MDNKNNKKDEINQKKEEDSKKNENEQEKNENEQENNQNQENDEKTKKKNIPIKMSISGRIDEDSTELPTDTITIYDKKEDQPTEKNNKPTKGIYLIQKKVEKTSQKVTEKTFIELKDLKDDPKLDQNLLLGEAESDGDNDGDASDESDIDDELQKEVKKQKQRKKQYLKKLKKKHNDDDDEDENIENSKDDDEDNENGEREEEDFSGDETDNEDCKLKQKRKSIREQTIEYLKESRNSRYRATKFLQKFLKKIRPIYSFLPLLFKKSNIFEIIYTSVINNYGTGIASYFNFFRSILFMDLCISIVILLFLFIPWFLLSGFTGINWSQFLSWDLLWGLLGINSKVIGNTFFYYGGYPSPINSTNTLTITSVDFYVNYFGQIYTFVMLVVFLICMFFLIFYIGKNLQSVTEEDSSLVYSRVILSTWDFGVTKKKSITELQSSISSQLKELIRIDEMNEKKIKNWKTIISLIIRRSIGWSLSAFLMIIAPIIVYFVNHYYNVINYYFVFTTSLITSFINVSFPTVIRFLVSFENYDDAKTTSWNAIIRSYFIKLVTTITTVIRLFSLGDLGDKCATNEAGLVFYQLIWIDFFTTVFSTILSNFIFLALKRKRLDFPLTQAAIQIFYHQCIVFIGFLQCPIIPFVGLFTGSILYFVRYFVLRLTMKFPDKPIANSKPTFFYSMLLITLYMSAIPMIIFSLTTQACGPHKNAIPYVQIAKFFNEDIFLVWKKISSALFNAFGNPFQLYSWVEIGENYLFSYIRLVVGYLTHPMLIFGVLVGVVNIFYFTYSAMVMYKKKAKRLKRNRRELNI